MKLRRSSTVFLILLLLLSACTNISSSTKSSSQSSSSGEEAKIVTSDTDFSINTDAGLMYMCAYYTRVGNACYVQVDVKFNGNDGRPTTLSAKAIDEQGRSYLPGNATDDSSITPGGTFNLNPGDDLLWNLEFTVSPGTHLTKLKIFQDDNLVKILDIDLTMES